jgi:hypothetical protein
MNWRTTWLLVGIAAALFAFIALFERRLATSDATPAPQVVLGGFKASEAKFLQVRRGTQFLIALEKTNGAWRYVKPFAYPASKLALENFLQTLEDVVPSTYISHQDMTARKQTVADFGFDAPAIVITIETASGREELRFGARTPSTEQVYLDVVGKTGIYVVPAAVLDRIPRTQHDWRDTALVNIPIEKVDRLEVTRAAGGFALQRDLTNKLWRLTRPAHRADQLKVEYLLKRFEEARIAAFLADESRADLDAIGLQTPEAELTLGSGNVVAERILFGRSPTNDPAHVFARQMSATNVVLVSTNILDSLRVPYTELRDRRLVAFAPETIDTIVVDSEEPFTVKKQANGAWAVAETPVDSAFVNEWVAGLNQLAVIDFVKDVVADFSPFGLAPARRQITLRTTVTNGLVLTNTIVTRLDFGSNMNADVVYARRADEDSVYTVPALDFARMPSAAWQLREHRLWNFSTNQVARVEVRQGGATRQFFRTPEGKWGATTGDINAYAMDELMLRLGSLEAVAWVGRGEAARAQFGFKPNNYRLTIDVKDGAKTQSLAIEFGGLSALRLPYASVTIDGQPWVFEFPWAIYAELQRQLAIPAVSANP